MVFGTHGEWVVRKVQLAELEEAGVGWEINRGRVSGIRWSYLFSGASALEATETETSCRPNILRMSNKQFVSRRCCPR